MSANIIIAIFIISSFLGFIFTSLKITGVLSWQWQWILAPFWGGASLINFLILIYELYDDVVNSPSLNDLTGEEKNDD